MVARLPLYPLLVKTKGDLAHREKIILTADVTGFSEGDSPRARLAICPRPAPLR
jgi:hypothetical protein